MNSKLVLSLATTLSVAALSTGCATDVNAEEAMREGTAESADEDSDSLWGSNGRADGTGLTEGDVRGVYRSAEPHRLYDGTWGRHEISWERKGAMKTSILRCDSSAARCTPLSDAEVKRQIAFSRDSSSYPTMLPRDAGDIWELDRATQLKQKWALKYFPEGNQGAIAGGGTSPAWTGFAVQTIQSLFRRPWQAVGVERNAAGNIVLRYAATQPLVKVN